MCVCVCVCVCISISLYNMSVNFFTCNLPLFLPVNELSNKNGKIIHVKRSSLITTAATPVVTTTSTFLRSYDDFFFIDFFHMRQLHAFKISTGC